MAQIETNGIRLEYETWGEPGGRPLLVVRGLGTQLIHWSPRLCERLVAAGHFLVTFDNRDVGLSTHLHEAGTPDLSKILAARARGEDPEVPYRLADMAADLIGLMDGLGLPCAHVAGMSLGGMIVQQAALDFPDRLVSMTSIMSTTGEPGLPGPTPEAAAALGRPPPDERSAYVEYSVETQRAFTGGGFPFDEAGWRALAGRVFDRAFDPAGVARQMAAIMASGSRHADLAKVSTPTLVIHGTDDPLVPPACGEATARAIPGARLHWIEGMGHDLPEGAWPDLVDAIAAHTAAAEAGAPARSIRR